MQDSAPVTRAEYDALRAQVVSLENLLRDYLVRRRESDINELAVIEDGLHLQRTRPRLDTPELVQKQIEYLQAKLSHQVQDYYRKQERAGPR